MLILGIMSGSSLDGFDFAICEFLEDPFSWNLISTHSTYIGDHLKKELAQNAALSLSEVLNLERRFTSELSEHVNRFLMLQDYKVDAIGLHGHTLMHDVENDISFQLGSGGRLSALCNTDVICDFRIQDVSLTGMGTPLVPIAERDLFPGCKFYLNLGGIANLSNFSGENPKAKDIVPCNQMLNFLASKLGFDYDHEGAIAKRGEADRKVVNQLSKMLQENDFSAAMDNNWITNNVLPFLDHSEISIENLLASCVAFISEEIANAIDEEGDVMITGGGTRNLYLVEELRQKLAIKNVNCIIPDASIVDFKEAILMAYLAYLRMKGKVNVLQSVTNATSMVSAGALYLKPIRYE